MARVAPADLAPWLAAYLREALAADGDDIEVGNREPDDLRADDGELIVVRADPGAKLSAVSFDCSAGVSVLAGTRQDDTSARALARRALAILTDDEIVTAPGSPIVSIEHAGINGPYAVAETQEYARQYFTVKYVTVGAW